jgi:putative lipoic acid-binding regulatory protein
MSRKRVGRSTHGNFYSLNISCRSRDQLERLRKRLQQLKARYKLTANADVLQRELGA